MGGAPPLTWREPSRHMGPPLHGGEPAPHGDGALPHGGAPPPHGGREDVSGTVRISIKFDVFWWHYHLQRMEFDRFHNGVKSEHCGVSQDRQHIRAIFSGILFWCWAAARNFSWKQDRLCLRGSHLEPNAFRAIMIMRHSSPMPCATLNSRCMALPLHTSLVVTSEPRCSG